MSRCIKFYTADAVPPLKTMLGQGVLKFDRLPRRYQVCGVSTDAEEATFWFDRLCAYREGPFVLVVEFVPTSRWDEVYFDPHSVPLEWIDEVRKDMQAYLK